VIQGIGQHQKIILDFIKNNMIIKRKEVLNSMMVGITGVIEKVKNHWDHGLRKELGHQVLFLKEEDHKVLKMHTKLVSVKVVVKAKAKVDLANLERNLDRNQNLNLHHHNENLLSRKVLK